MRNKIYVSTRDEEDAAAPTNTKQKPKAKETEFALPQIQDQTVEDVLARYKKWASVAIDTSVAALIVITGSAMISLGIYILPLAMPVGVIAIASGITLVGAASIAGRHAYLVASDRIPPQDLANYPAKVAYSISKGVSRAVEKVRKFVRSTAEEESESLEEILQNSNEQAVSANSTIPNSGAIKDAFESDISTYRLAANSFIKSLPDNATSHEIITLANSYYQENSTPKTEAAKARMSDDEKEQFTENREYFLKNLVTMNYGQSGEINDARISQAIFFSEVAACIKHPEKLLAGEEDEKRKAETIADLEKQKLEEGLERHLLRINRDLKNNQSCKLAVGYAYQFVRDGEHKTLGQETHTANPVEEVAKDSWRSAGVRPVVDGTSPLVPPSPRRIV